MKKHVAWHIVRACLLPAVLFSSRALADCAQDFARDNAYKPHAGAHRMHERKLPLSLLDGQWVPTLKQEIINTISEVVPPNATRITSDGLFGPIGLVVIGDRGWIRANGDAAWEPLNAAESKEILDGAFTSYLSFNRMSDLSCTRAEHNGRPARVYHYKMPSELQIGSHSEITAYFDDQTGLPVHVEVEDGNPRQRAKSTVSIAFDSAIAIQPPETAGQTPRAGNADPSGRRKSLYKHPPGEAL
ncbi:hypothetical protein KDH83_03470 [Achromobacter sp. Marseille-Q0513]|uniref:hypothetical protein n=1 Tax=Achromobacter sp. Marseille-Q0513 TaxID=2829161 RepID=UPI001BA39618|nr:hypothetical protein [Achromobacter sp. Marseille-Q0513]MBR8652365.1 hypothetical protein [Achromobacter sp. Marseille-Q0513]